MREFLDVTFLGVLQGVAEFLPISSSGHLVIGQSALGVNAPGMRLDIFLHVGTVFAIFAYYRRQIAYLASGLFSPSPERRRESWEYAGKIILSALPAIVVYALFKQQIENLFENAKMVGALLMFTGAVLMGTRFLPRGDRKVNVWRSLLMGIGQSIALLPGVSRSGMTLASARGGGVAPEAAAEFSFLMSTPLIIGAAFLEAFKAFGGDAAVDAAAAGPSWGIVAYGAAVSAVVGYFSLAWLVKVLKGRWFWAFGPYCIIAGLLTICLC